MAAVASLALLIMLPKGMHGDTQTIGDRIRVLSNPGVLRALVTTLLFMLAAYPPLIFVGAVMDETGIAAAALPFVLFANGVGAIGAGLSAGRLADRIGNRLTVTLSCVGMLVGLAGLVSIPYLPQDVRLGVLVVAFAVMGYVGWAYWIAHCSQMAHLAPSSVPVAISLDLTALNLGVAIAAGFGGIIVDRWGATSLAIAAVPVAIATLAIWVMVPNRPAAAESAS